MENHGCCCCCPVVVTDSAMGTALPMAQFPDGLGPWWAASVVASHPHLIQQIHQQNIDAGSDVILSATYQAYSVLPEALRQPVGGTSGAPLRVQVFDQCSLDDVCLTAIRLAAAALGTSTPASVISRCGSPPPRIGLSVGPIGSALPGGLEFTGQYVVKRDALRAFYSGKLSTLMRSYREVFPVGDAWIIFETFPRLDEAQLVLELFSELAFEGSSCESSWHCTISFVTHSGTHLPCGAPIGAVFAAVQPFMDMGLVAGMGFNCCYSLCAERAAMTLLETTTAVGSGNGNATSSSLCGRGAYLVWKPNASPEAVPDAAHGTHLMEAFHASSRRIMARVLENHRRNHNNADHNGERYRFDKLLCGGCCGTTADDIQWLSALRASLMSDLQ